jgi:hypothetical protein
MARALQPHEDDEGGLHCMARKPNYDLDKRRKETERKARKDAKRAERQQRRDERQPEDAPTAEPISSSDEHPSSSEPPGQ